ncbi:sensor histidine kinase [Marimonas arenosa]|uniref:C4-dicarboxylate transport sensor protein DctB n=1 Tax=Marimonas arenosa TaxID=1795305 RepID=A0AAE4B4R8_9RHOB|nr:ATP-binding protein [Marimonas arenosa]MDQ2088386.1 ATP-binding protein [Marimonas arenosa]
MEHGVIRRGWLVLGFLAAVAAMSAGIFTYGYGQALDRLAQQGMADLSLATDRLTGQLQRYQEMAVLLAPHPTLDAGDRDAANALLLAASDKTAALNLIHVDRTGRVLARATAAGAQSVAQGPWVERAMHGALGSGHGFFGDDARRAYVYAAPRFAADGGVTGALVVAVDLAALEDDWRGSRPAVFFVDQAGVVFISNRSELLFWRRDGEGLRPQDGAEPSFAVTLRSGQEIWALDWGPYIPRRALHLKRDLPVIGMRAEALVDTLPALRLAGLQAAVFAALWLVFGAFLYLAMERRRALTLANRLLEARVDARTKELKRAQADLVQAGKLSALGQMSAGISHELNQPLMAIRQFAENGAAFLDRNCPERAQENLGRISDMAARAARIIRNLRAFARNESEPMGRVDLGQVIDTAVELTEARLRKDEVALDWVRPAGPVFALGGEVRLAQVFVNLINNAADAMAGQEGSRRIRIGIEEGPQLAVTVRDTGPGISDPDRIFEPFYSTKEVGSEEGMGLGLSISYGLVQSFGGNIRGENCAPRGAAFTVELERWQDEEAAA